MFEADYLTLKKSKRKCNLVPNQKLNVIPEHLALKKTQLKFQI